MQVIDIDINHVHQFSKKDNAYINGINELHLFLNYQFNFDEFEKAIENRKQFHCDRQLLVSVINEQYQTEHSSSTILENISALLDDNTFTVTTAHQPSLMTGPLYYIYKILSTIKLSQKLKAHFPHQHFVPLFVIGGEDHDFEEINHFNLFNKRIEWICWSVCIKWY